MENGDTWLLATFMRVDQCKMETRSIGMHVSFLTPINVWTPSEINTSSPTANRNHYAAYNMQKANA